MIEHGIQPCPFNRREESRDDEQALVRETHHGILGDHTSLPSVLRSLQSVRHQGTATRRAHDGGRIRLIDQVASFGTPSPIIVFTGGDPLLRGDLFDLLSHAADAGVRFALSPAVTELLSYDALKRIRDAGVSAVSVSLDGACAQTHDSIRRIDGTYQRTVQAMKDAVSLGLNIQVNTAIMKSNYTELPQLFHLIRGLGVKTWELFFLVKVGRGSGVDDLTPEEVESVCNFLYDASFYGMMVRNRRSALHQESCEREAGVWRLLEG